MNFSTTMNRRNALKLAGGIAAATTVAAALGGIAIAQEGAIKITQIRNATLRVDYAGVRFLVDPMLADAGAFPAFPNTPNQVANPTVPLPVSIESLLEVDALIVTHLHEDHWDAVARASVPKSMPIFVQDEADAAVVRADGFEDVRLLTSETEFNGVTLARTGGLHGNAEVIGKMGEDFGRVCGVAFKQDGQKTVYLAGDTVWNERVAEAITTHQPDIIILNAGQAYIFGIGSILMSPDEVLAVHNAAPQARIIATHMEAVNHCIVTRGYLQAFADQHGFLDQLNVPADGEALTY